MAIRQKEVRMNSIGEGETRFFLRRRKKPIGERSRKGPI